MAFDHILFDRPADGIWTVTVNRPDKLNALNAATVAELHQAFEHCRSDPGGRALIVTGAGPTAFVAGADITELAVSDTVRSVELAARGQAVFRMLETMNKPSVAAINGF